MLQQLFAEHITQSLVALSHQHIHWQRQCMGLWGFIMYMRVANAKGTICPATLTNQAIEDMLSGIL